MNTEAVILNCKNNYLKLQNLFICQDENNLEDTVH